MDMELFAFISISGITLMQQLSHLPELKNIGTLKSYPRPFRFRQCFYLNFMQ